MLASVVGRLLAPLRIQPINALRSMANSTQDIISTNHNGKQFVILNRPKALNALNMSMVRKLYPAFKSWRSDLSVILVIMKGAGDKAFCAGGDVVAVTKSALSGDPKQTVHKDFFREEYMLNHEIGVFPKPFIAIIDGITMGGGCGLSINGKFRVATERTVLAMPETALGLFPDVGGSYFLPRLPLHLGQFLALTGYRLKGADVFHAGLATHYIDSSSLKEMENELMEMKNSLVTNETVKEVLDKYHVVDLPKFTLEPNLAQIDFAFGGETLDSVIEKLKKSDHLFMKQQLAILGKMSPTSMKVTFKQLQKGMKMKFKEVFTMEYRLTQRFMQGNDFHEGCRAILIDKDQKPKWEPATLNEVTDEMVDNYFAPLPPSDDFTILS